MFYYYKCNGGCGRVFESEKFYENGVAPENCRNCESEGYFYIGRKENKNDELIPVEKKTYPKITFFSDEENKDLKEESFTNVSCRPRGTIDLEQLEAVSKIIGSESDQKKSKKMEAQFGCKHPGSLISFGVTREAFLQIALIHLEWINRTLNNEEWQHTADMLRGITSGDSFTSKRDKMGEITAKENELSILWKNIDQFFAFTKVLLFESGKLIDQFPTCNFTIYRVLHSNNVKEKKQGDVHLEILPFSATHNLCWAVKNWVKLDSPCIFEIEVPINFGMIICSYPEQFLENRETPLPLNQNQREVALAPMKLLITEKFVVEMEGKVITMFKTRLKAIPQNEVLEVLKKNI
jgi:hypothetical protein